MNNKKKIFLAGHKGMVGSAIYKKLKINGYKNILVRSKSELNLLDQNKTFRFLKKNKPDFVILAAARVGGIKANLKNKDKFIYENLQIQNNIIHGSYLAGVKKLIFTWIKLYLSEILQPTDERKVSSYWTFRRNK